MFKLFIKKQLRDSGIKPEHFEKVAERAEKLGVKDFYGSRLTELGREVDEGVRLVEANQARGDNARAAIEARKTKEALETIIEIGKVGRS